MKVYCIESSFAVIREVFEENYVENLGVKIWPKFKGVNI